MKVLYKLINSYTQRFNFPKRGWKYFSFFLKTFRLADYPFQKKIFNGLFMYVNTTDHIQKNLFWYGSYEKAVSCIWQHFVKKDNRVLDIGANIGYYALLAAQVATEGRVYAFEPVSFIRDQLNKNISLNQLSNITVLPFCVSNKKEPATLFIAAGNNTGMSGLHPPENFSGTTETVSSVVIDDWMALHQIERVDLIKIDVEGAEMKVLDGMQNTIEKHRPVVFIEVMESLLAQFDTTVTDVYTFFFSRNYKAFEIITSKELKPAGNNHEGYDLIFIPDGYALPETLTIKP